METSFYKNSLGHLSVNFNKTDAVKDLIRCPIEFCYEPPPGKSRMDFCPEYKKYSQFHKPVKYENPFNKEKPFDMQEIGKILAITEILIFAITYVFLNRIEYTQRIYIENYKSRVIEMDDFSVTVRGLPPDFKFNADDELLKMMLKGHFEKVADSQQALEGDKEDELKTHSKVIDV